MNGVSHHEYNTLRDEILRWHSEIMRVATFVVTASGAFLAASFQLRNPVAALIPLPLIVMGHAVILNNAQAIARISTYLSVYWEEEQRSREFRWETHLRLFRDRLKKLSPGPAKTPYVLTRIVRQFLEWAFYGEKNREEKETLLHNWFMPRPTHKELWLGSLIEHLFVNFGWAFIFSFFWISIVVLWHQYNYKHPGENGTVVTVSTANELLEKYINETDIRSSLLMPSFILNAPVLFTIFLMAFILWRNFSHYCLFEFSIKEKMYEPMIENWRNVHLTQS